MKRRTRKILVALELSAIIVMILALAVAETTNERLAVLLLMCFAGVMVNNDRRHLRSWRN